jgi:glucokinase
VSKERAAIGADVGGTYIKSGVVALDGTISRFATVPTFGRQGRDASVGTLLAAVRRLRDGVEKSGKEVIGVGIGCPGPLDPKRGFVYNAVNLPGWVDLPLADIVGEETGLRVLVDNDANLFTLGEWWRGAAKGARCAVGVTVGTGIGGGIVVGGEIWHGASGGAGEIGHVTAVADGIKCSCGKKGCVEAYSSAAALVLRTLRRMRRGARTELNKWGDDFTVKNIVDVARGGDVFAEIMIADVPRYLGVALGSIVNLLGPDVIVVGGGMAALGDLLFPPLMRAVKANCLPSAFKATKILRARLGTKGGVVGAGKIVWDALGR